jgi:hypothetical protein
MRTKAFSAIRSLTRFVDRILAAHLPLCVGPGFPSAESKPDWR